MHEPVTLSISRRHELYTAVIRIFFSTRRHAYHAGRNIVLPFLSVCPSVRLFIRQVVVLYLNEGTYQVFSTIQHRGIILVLVANVAESWHSKSVVEGHLPSNCYGEDTVLCSSRVRLLFSSRPSET